ncbi:MULTISPECIES: hypothetical protein [Streptomyces]|uniref:hypothetical protein n=1 Tax=Streptomyces TaxID=1883 RepID=UPI0021086E52|nr:MULTISPECIES: hypothetical protein [Streptomyces]UUA11589.1 hypothetical protein NNW98_38910 [Streptomyces koelreuteriae]UUA19206.1 hypothetical protein NNW99_38905 [Streptomyces sp. CRCS-T-1]
MANKLIAAGTNRLRKAEDSAVDPAVPADLQKGTTEPDSKPEPDASGPSVFARGRVLSADDIKGTPEEQLAFVIERLHEIDLAGKRAEDFTLLNKAVLLEVAQQRELHLVAGHTNFSVWAAGVLDIEPKYVFELLQDADRIRAIGELGPDLAQHLTRASARKVMADVIAGQGLEAAQVVMTEGLAQAEQQGKKRPTASLLASIARELTAPSIPAQEKRSEISDPPIEPREPATPPAVAALERAVSSLKERVYSPLAPGSVQDALAADPVTTRTHLERLEQDVQRVVRRLTAATRAAAAAGEHPEAPTS